VKAGNSVEDKTLRIRKGSLDFSISSLRDGKPWTGGMGSRGREARLTAQRSRYRVARRDEGTRKPEGDDRAGRKGTEQKGNLGGQ